MTDTMLKVYPDITLIAWGLRDPFLVDQIADKDDGMHWYDAVAIGNRRMVAASLPTLIKLNRFLGPSWHRQAFTLG